MASTPALYAAGAAIEFTAPGRSVDTVWLHCSASDKATHDDVSVMRSWHLARGWNDVGYHLFIRKNGDIQSGRPLEKVPSAQKGYNTGAIAICLHGLEEAKFTLSQYESVIRLCTAIREAYSPTLRFRGHKEVAAKACPVFNYKRVLGLNTSGHMTGATTTRPGAANSPPTSGQGSVKPGDLDLGDRGNAVKVLQNLLVVNGIACGADGIFGQQTGDSLRDFQRRAGLMPSAVADSATKQALAKGLPGIRDLKAGDRGEDVKAFQRIIGIHEIVCGADGAFGSQTTGAVERFQRKYGAVQSGIVDANTRAKAWS